ncbi:magnesium/cobalt transporter CorA [Candidatus Gracilibacteria bacterium]|nr:magnesium/cobalt transporter CorA [Candidatus Gracilibacteria bacterium]
MHENEIEKIVHKEGGFTWISISSPNEDSIKYLKQNYDFHPLDLEDCLSGIQRPKIDDYEDYLFLVLRTPIHKKKQIRGDEVDIFISQKYIITVHHSNPIIKKVFANLEKDKVQRKEYMEKGTGYFLHMIIDDIFESGFPLLEDISKQISDLEHDVFDTVRSRDRLREILLLKKDIINFRRIIMPQRAIIAQLEHKNKKFLPENLDVYFDDIVDKIEKMWNQLENLQELVVSLHETNESIISHNTNNVIKVLTLFSVIMLPLTFITGFYGMNIANLPYSEGNESALIVSGFMILVVFVMLGIFKYKKWL